MNRPNFETAHKKAAQSMSGDSRQSEGHNFSPRTARPQARTKPPYSNQARQRLDPSQARRIAAFSTLFIHAGRDAWDWKDDPRAFVLSPNFQDVEACDWSVCKLACAVVLVIDRGATDDHLERVALACLRDGAQKVLVLQPGQRSTLLVGQEVRHGTI